MYSEYLKAITYIESPWGDCILISQDFIDESPKLKKNCWDQTAVKKGDKRIYELCVASS